MIKLEKNRKNFIQLQLANEERLKEFFDFLNLFVCKRCWSRAIEKDKPQKPYHHHGALYQLLSSSKKIPHKHLEIWQKETEHGYLHGLLVLYFAWFLTGQSNLELLETTPKIGKSEIMILSCLFHDFVKVCHNTEEGHDGLLKNWFDYLSEDTYSHANPKLETPLVMGDRIELMRFHDHNKWVNISYLDKPIQQYGYFEIKHFYNHIRPVLDKLFKSLNETWIAHVLEESDNLEVNYFPKNHWFACDEGYEEFVDKNTGKLYSVNTGRLPCVSIGSCVGHTASNGFPRGLISFRNLLKNGCDIVSAPSSTWGRDHAFVLENKKIPLDQWIFLYDDIQDLNKLDLNFNCSIMERSLFNYIFYVSENLFNKIHMMTVDRESFLNES